MNSNELRKHLLEQLQKDKQHEAKFMNAFRNKLSDAQGAMLSLNNENKPSIDLVSNARTTDNNIDTQLIEALFPYIKDYGKIDTVLADPDITMEFKKAMLYNFKTEVEPRLENIKNKKISVDEFQNYLKNMAKDLLANEAVFTTAVNTNATTLSAFVINSNEDKKKFVNNAIDKMTQDNDIKIANSPINLDIYLSKTKEELSQLAIALSKIDRNFTSLYLATEVVFPADEKSRLKEKLGYISDTSSVVSSYFRNTKLLINKAKEVYKHYFDEVKSYALQKALDPIDIYTNIRKIYSVREKTLTSSTISTPTASAVAGSGISVKHQNINNKYYIDRSKLNKNILEIRYVKNRHLIPVKPQVISSKFKSILESKLNNGNFNPKDTYELVPKEKHLIQVIAPYLNIDKNDIDESDEYHQRFEVIRGSILAGNNNESIKKEARKYLLHAYKMGQINRMSYLTMIEELDL